MVAPRRQQSPKASPGLLALAAIALIALALLAAALVGFAAAQDVGDGLASFDRNVLKCFGGVHERHPAFAARNAYLLVYRRMSAADVASGAAEIEPAPLPPLPEGVASSIAAENAEHARLVSVREVQQS